MAWSPGPLGEVGGPADGAGSGQRDERGREAIACGRWTRGGKRSSSTDPAATIGQAPPGLARFAFGLIAQLSPQAPTPVPWLSRV
jgi:hypothetical protein